MLNKTHPTRADQLRNSANYITERMEGLSQMCKTRAKLPMEDDWWDFTPPESGPEGWMHTLPRGWKLIFFFFHCSSHGYLEYEIMSSRPESRSAVVLVQRWSRNGLWPVQLHKCKQTDIHSDNQARKWRYRRVCLLVKGWFRTLLFGNTKSSPPSTEIVFSVAKYRFSCSLCSL